jgi:hypothetical protein
MTCGQAEAELRQSVRSDKPELGSGKKKDTKEHDMEKLFTLALVIAVSLGTTAVLANSGHSTRPAQTAAAHLASDGAFRDGLYLGKLAAERGGGLRPPIGRWSGEQDRASFVAGYRRGYNDSHAGEVFGASRPE